MIESSKLLFMTIAAAGLVSCAGEADFDPSGTADAGDKVERVEPLSWWTGMKTPLQLLIKGPDISSCDVRIEGGTGVKVSGLHKGDSPDYLFADVEISADAAPGTYYIVFSHDSTEFKYPYEIAARAGYDFPPLGHETAAERLLT